MPQTDTETLAVPDPFQQHRLDLKAQEEGKWVQVRGDKFLVASYHAKKVAEARAEVLRDMGLAVGAELTPEQATTADAKLFARAVLKACKLEHHPALTYSTAIGERIATDPELASLYLFLRAEAWGDYTKNAVAKAAILGNS